MTKKVTKKVVKKVVSKDFIVKGYFCLDEYDNKPYFSEYDDGDSVPVEIVIPKTLFPKPTKRAAIKLVLTA